MNHNGTWSKKINGKQSKNPGIYVTIENKGKAKEKQNETK